MAPSMLERSSYLQLPKPIKPVLFLDDWPQPPRCRSGNSSGQSDDQLELDAPGMNEVKKWRLQTLLAVNPWGIPSLAFAHAYKLMFSKELDIGELGFEHLSDMINNLPEVFTVQEPDEVTALLFPDYQQDRILHDARVGHDFLAANDTIKQALDNIHAGAGAVGGGVRIPNKPDNGSQMADCKTVDAETLIGYAWFNRDDDFPPDAALAGERYKEPLLPMTSAQVPGTRGLHQAILVGAANPAHFYINIKSEYMDQIDSLSGEVQYHLEHSGCPVESYSVPEEFLYPGFPCLVYLVETRSWERCQVVSRNLKGNKILVETVDFGGFRSVDPIYLYLMPRKFLSIPKQGILVSLMGVKPGKEEGKWSPGAGMRVRCFSNVKYWLDCLLIEPKRDHNGFGSVEEVAANADTISLKSGPDNNVKADNSSRVKGPSRKRKLKLQQMRQPQFEVIINDRNDDELDVYLDEILVLETYALRDEGRAQEVEEYRQKLKEALRNVPRPVNPLK